MAFEYSIFISYRHHELDKVYFENLNKFIKSEIFKATGVSETFYDRESIEWGSRWKNKIYSGLEQSYFFLPVWFYHYIDDKNIWCAKELYHALKIEETIRNLLDENDREDFVYIFPLIYRGDAQDFPKCLSDYQAIKITEYEYLIKANKPSSKFTKLLIEIHNVLFKRYKIMEKYIKRGIDFQTALAAIQKPTDEEVINWVKLQTTDDIKKITKEKEADKFPGLVKNGE